MIEHKRMTSNEIMAYASPGMCIGFFYLYMLVYIPKFYTDVIGIDVATVGLILLLTRIWDAASDTIIGHISDRTYSKYGRRKPWLFITVLPFCICTLLFFSPPVGMSQTSAVLWFTITLMFTITAYTSYIVPYLSEGAELSQHYRERTRLFGMRGIMIYLGTILASLLMVFLTPYVTAESIDLAQRQKFVFSAWIFIAILILTTLYTLFINKEPALRESQKPRFSFFKNFRVFKSNRPFLIYSSVFFIGASSSATSAALLLFYTEYIIQTQLGPLLLLAYLIMVVISVPFWIWFANKFDKPVAFKLACLICAASYVFIFFLGAGDVIWFFVLLMIIAASLGAVLVSVMPSMLPDIIDLDEYQHGIRREGAYVGIGAVLAKLGAGIGLGIVFLVLGLAGYQSGVTPGDTAQLVIRIMYAGWSIFALLIQFVLIHFYTIDKARHAQIRREIDEKLSHS